MINLLILFSILVIFIQYDVMLRFGRVFDREGAIRYSEHLLDLSLTRIFSLVRTYRGFKFHVEDRVGADWPERFILVANHQSIVDIPVLGYLCRGKRIRFVAKKELGAGVPLVSQALRMQKHALVQRRGNPAQALKALDRFAVHCRQTGSCPVIFPEGTRSKDGSLGTFHTGGLKRVLVAESLPLVVIALDGGWRIHGIKTIMKNLKGASYRVRIAGVIPAPGTRQEIIDAVAESHRLVEEALKDWRG